MLQRLLWGLRLRRETEHDWWLVQVHAGTHEETQDETDDEFGFYTTRVVRAGNEHEATERALDSIRLELDGSFPSETLAQLTLWVTRLHRCRQRDAERIPTTGFTFYGERLRP